MTAADPPDPPKPGVLESLPTTRPQRRSAKRDGPSPATADKAPTRTKAAKPRSKPRPKPARPNPTAPVATQGYEPDRTPIEPPTSADVLVTAVQAAGELAQIGITLGEQLLRSAIKRLPRP